MDRAGRQRLKKHLKQRLARLFPENRGFNCVLNGDVWTVDTYLDFDLPRPLGDLMPDGVLAHGAEAAAFLAQKCELVRHVLGDAFGAQVALKGYNLTCPFPPMHAVAYENGRPSRPLTVHEQEARLDLLPVEFHEQGRRDIRYNEWASQFFRFVPGPEFEDECWQLAVFPGFNLRVHFHVPVEWEEGGKSDAACPQCAPVLVLPDDLNQNRCAQCGRVLYSLDADRSAYCDSCRFAPDTDPH